jgi:hypothetical protein
VEELKCDRCNAHIGWMHYCGPRGFVYCDSCKEEQDREEEEREKEE